MILDDLGLSNLTLGGSTIAALTWIWRKMTGIESKITNLELKIAENYVTKPEFKVIEEKLDKHNEIINTKIDNLSNNILNLSTLIAKK